MTSTKTESIEGAFLGLAGLVFVGSTAATISWCVSMSVGMPMPGGWTMSMAWMRMPGQSWLGATAAFMEMWMVMMLAMMLPPLVPMLTGYRRSVLESGGGGPLGVLTFTAGAGYFFVWAVYGAVAYPLGVALGAGEMQWPALARFVPLATGLSVFLAGCVQMTAWKASQLGHCRDAASCRHLLASDLPTAWRHGVRLGVHCSLCCSSFILILLVAGVMDLRAMALVGVAIAAERLAPWPQYVARVAGLVIMAVGLLLVARALVTP